MGKKRAVIAVAVLLVGLAALGWWRYRSKPTPKTSGDEVAAVDPVARRIAARKGGEVSDQPSAIRGRVVDEAGAPLAGALISVSRRSLDGGAALKSVDDGEPLTAVSAADGTFEVSPIIGGVYSVSATARERLAAVVEPVPVRAGIAAEGIELVLRRGGHALSGTVSDIGGGPVEGALVRATRVSAFTIDIFFRAPLSTKTDSEGHYALSLANGVYGVEVVHGDYESADDSVEVAGGPRTLDFRLTPGAVIEGVVIARDSGKPVANALVSIQQENAPIVGVGFGGSAQTDADGKFVLRGLSSGVVALQAVARGYVSYAPTEVELGIAERVTDVVIQVDGAFTISGFVVDKANHEESIADVIVGAYNFSPGVAYVAAQPSAADGYFEIFGVRPGTYTVAGAGEQRIPTLFGETITVEDRDLEGVVVELDGGVAIRGRIEPASVAQISLEVDTESIGLGNMMQLASAVLVHGTSAEDGTFELRGVGAGTFAVVAKPEDGREGRTPVTVADVDLEGVVIKLEDRARVAGIVVDESGRPIEGVNVAVAPDKEGDFMSMVSGNMFGGGAPTGPDGRFEAKGLAPGGHKVTVSDDIGQLAWADTGTKNSDAERYKAKRIEIVGTTTPPELKLVVEARGEEIRGRVLGPDGAPIADAWVTAQYIPPDGMSGRFDFGGGDKKDNDDDAPQNAGDGAKGEGDGKKGSVTISIGTGGASGKVEQAGEDDDGDGASETDVTRWNPREKPVLSDADGKFVIQALRKGSYNLEAEGLKGSARGKLDKVMTGTTVTVKLGGLATLRGVVTRNGEPVRSYVVDASGASDRRSTVFSNDGAYELRRLDPGKYTIAVNSTEGRGTGDVDVTAGEIETVNIALVSYGSVRGQLVDAVTGKPMADKLVFAMSDEGMDPSQMAAALVKGDGPRTDAEGRFRVGGLGAGKGSVMITSESSFGGSFIAQQEFSLTPGQDLDLGVLKGTAALEVEKDKRGTLGLAITGASWTERPARKAGESDSPPAGLDADTKYIWIIKVDDPGPAKSAGLLVGDRLISIDGVPVDAVGPLVAYQMLSPNRVAIGQTVALVIDRDGEANTIKVTAIAPPAVP